MFTQNRQAGFSLLSVLMAAGISSFIAAGLMGMFSNSIKAQLHLERRSEYLGVQQHLMAAVDCRKTFAKFPKADDGSVKCPNGKAVDLLGSDGRLVARGVPGIKGFQGSRQLMGNYFIKASCQNDKLVVRAARKLTAQWSFSQEPLRGFVEDFHSERNPLLGGSAKAPSLCRGSFEPETSETSQHCGVTLGQLSTFRGNAPAPEFASCSALQASFMSANSACTAFCWSQKPGKSCSVSKPSLDEKSRFYRGGVLTACQNDSALCLCVR